jgi:hypothetical protein
MNFNFNFGKKKPDPKQLIIVSVVLTTIIGTLSQCTGVSQNAIWDLLDEIQRKYFPQGILNELILKDPEKLDRRIKRDVDHAIDDYWKKSGLKPAEVDKPKFIEKDIDTTVCYTKECQSLGGEMRLCGPWVFDCKKDDEQNDSISRP